MLKIGIIGAGLIGRALAMHVTRAGYEVLISNSRGPESLSDFLKGINGKISAVDVKEAAMADVVFLAVPWKNIPDVVSAIPSWEGRIVIDASNPIIMPGFQIQDLKGKMSSEVVAESLPKARVVKAFNTFAAALLAEAPNEAGGRRVVFISGNDASANTLVAGIIDKMGYACIDLGKLNEGGRLQNFPSGPLPNQNLIKLP